MSTQHKNIAEKYLHEPKGVSTAAVGTVYQADGAGSGNWASIPGTSSKVVTVNAASDLPAAASGIRTLVPGVTYVLSGNIDIGGDRIVMTAGSALKGAGNRFADFITSSTTGALISATGVSFQCAELGFIVASGDVINLVGGSGETAVFTNCYTVTCKKVGTISNWRTTVFRSFSQVAATDPTSGALTFAGACTSFNMDNSLWQSWTAGTMIDLSTATFDRVQLTTGNRFVVGSGITGISGLASSGNINASGRGILDDIIFEGAGTYLNNVAATGDTRWEVDCAGVPKSTRNAQGYNHTAVNTTSVGATPKLVTHSGNFVSAHADQFTVSTDGRLTYNGEDDFEFHVRCVSNGTVSASTHTFSHYIAKNGTEITASKILREYSSGSNGTVTTAAIVTLSKGDYVEQFISCSTGTVTWVNNISNMVVTVA